MAIRRGNTGEQVKDLQNKLKAAGFDPGNADGIFGPKTEAAVKQFQAASAPPVDGIVGPKTTKALDKASAPKSDKKPVKSSGGGGQSLLVFPDEYTLDEIQEKLNDAYNSAPPKIKERAGKVKSIVESSLYKMKEMYITDDKKVINAKKVDNTPSKPTTDKSTSKSAPKADAKPKDNKQSKSSKPTTQNKDGSSILRKGSRGNDVKQLQEKLRAMGYTEVGKADGIYGPNTQRAVLRFQIENGLQSDGIAGPKTKQKLDGSKGPVNVRGGPNGPIHTIN